MTQEWLKRAQAQQEARDKVYKKIKGNGGPVGPTEPVDMGGDGNAYQVAEIQGDGSSVELKPGVEVPISTNTRIVQTTEGELVAISGGDGQPVRVRDAKRIAPELANEIENAVSRQTNRARRRLRK